MLFTAAAITVAIVGVAGVRALMRDDASSPAAHEAGWDAVAVVARTGGDITLVSPQGTIVGEYEKLGRAAQVEVAGSHLALIGSTSVTLLDLAAETDTEPTVVPIERGATVTRLATNSAHLLLAAGRPAGGEVTLIDGITGWSANLGELGGLRAPRLFVDTIRTDPTGDTIAIADAGLRRAGIPKPRLAVAGLNPHAGEGGLFGREEIDIIAPAIEAARADGIEATGPHPPDTVFMQARGFARFDAVIAMYHDQGLIPVKYLGIDEGVNVTLGLPFVRTSPDHGTAYDIAGQGVADPASLLAAIRLADRLAPKPPAG